MAAESKQTGLDSFITTAVGDRVTDTLETDEQSPMRVVDPDVGRADAVTVEGTEVSDHDGNEQFPDDDRVVEVVYENHLDNLVRGWKDMLGESFAAQLGSYESEWGVSVDRYHFPASRLESVATPEVEQAEGATVATTGGESA
jgi:hypothetical protein